MIRARAAALAAILASTALALGTAFSPGVAAADGATDAGVVLVAYLDGQPIPLQDVSRYYCDDFAYPTITCSTSALITSTRASVTQLLTGVDYVTIFDKSAYGGSFMHVSQDYTALVLIGWNDKISSFKARNSETGEFWTDWFYGGTAWSFCCNSQVPSLGAYDNTFSSVVRT